MCRWYGGFANAHVSQQSHFIFNTQGECAVDYIARTEHMAEDWVEIIHIIRQYSRLNVHFVPMRPAKSNPANSTHPCFSEKAAALGQLTEETLQAIAKQHAMDLHLLGFMPPSRNSQQDQNLGSASTE